MALPIAVIVRDDPRTSHRPVEALRIALGLAAGEHDVTVVLLGSASLLLSDETDEVVDVDILEKYLPSFQHLGIPFVVPREAETSMTIQPGFTVRREGSPEIRHLIAGAHQALVF